MTSQARLRLVWGVAAATVVAATLAAIVTVARGELGLTEARAILSLPDVLLCAGEEIASLELLDRQRVHPLGVVALLSAGVEVVAFIVGIWKGQVGDGSNEYAKLVPTALAWAIVTLAVATFPLIAHDRRLMRTIFPGVTVCAVAGALLATILIWTENDSQGWGKTLAVLGILMVAGYVLPPVLDRLLRLNTSTSGEEP